MVNLATKIVSDTETFSVERLNQKMITRMTGIEISNHDTNKPLNINCIEDGSNFLKGHGYFIDDLGEIHDYFKQHTHQSNSDGGSYYDLLQANAKDIIEMNHSAGSMANLYHNTKSGAGIYKDTLDTADLYVEMTTATAQDDFVNAMYGGGRLYFGKPIFFECKYGISHATNILVKLGTGITNVENEAGIGSQICFEFCSSGGNLLMGIVSAGGAARSTDFLSEAVQSVPIGLRFDYYPSSKIDAIDGLGMEVLHDDDLPQTTAATNPSNLFRAGVRATAISSARTLRLHSARLVGYSFDSTSGVKGWA